MPINSLGIIHILPHTLAEQPLRIKSSEFRYSSSADGKSSKGKYERTDSKTMPRAQRDQNYLSQSLCQKHLEFLYKEVFRIVYTNKHLDDTAWLVSSEFYWHAGNKHIFRSIRLRFLTRRKRKESLPGPASIGSGSQFGPV
jgi:hypothetical protein